ncbi:MAG TPA: hypothetical protein VGM97_10070, partial [Steroidobacteraceae bacterium]
AHSGGILDGLTIGGGLHMSVSSNDGAGVITVPNTLTGIGSVSPPVAAGDVFVMRAYANIASANTIGDAMFVNPLAPSGLDTDAEKGNVVWIISGKGKGQKASIASNTATTLTIDGAWLTTPDATSVFVILEGAPTMPPIDTAAFQNSAVGSAGITAMKVVARVTVPMTEAATYLVQVASEDRSGRTSVVAYAPWQEIYLTPELTQKTIAASSYDVLPTDEVITLGSGAGVVNLLSQAGALRRPLWLVNESGVSVTVNAASGETIEGNSSLPLATGARIQIIPRS